MEDYILRLILPVNPIGVLNFNKLIWMNLKNIYTRFNSYINTKTKLNFVFI